MQRYCTNRNTAHIKPVMDEETMMMETEKNNEIKKPLCCSPVSQPSNPLSVSAPRRPKRKRMI